MIERSIVISEEDLIRYLKQDWRGFETKDYELLAALLLCRFHRKHFGQIFQIGLPVLINTDEDIPNEYEYSNIESILKNYIKEDTPIDIFLVPNKNIEEAIGKHKEARRIKIRANAFQIKKVGSRESGEITESIANFLNKLSKKYAPIEASLVLVIGGGKTNGIVDLSKLRCLFKPKSFPFKTVLFMTGNKEKITFGEIWPNFGTENFPVNDIFYL